jgi:hypothetical protein
LTEAAPFLIDNKSYNPTYFNPSIPAIETSKSSETFASSQETGECNHTTSTPSRPTRPSPPPYPRKLIYQQRPEITSIAHPVFGCRRSFTFALDTYDHAAKKEYILLMRNFELTKQYPTHHITINHFRPMQMKVFSKLLTKVFEHLARLNIIGYLLLNMQASRALRLERHKRGGMQERSLSERLGEASRIVLGGLELRSDVDYVHSPDRYGCYFVAGTLSSAYVTVDSLNRSKPFSVQKYGLESNSEPSLSPKSFRTWATYWHWIVLAQFGKRYQSLFGEFREFSDVTVRVLHGGVHFDKSFRDENLDNAGHYYRNPDRVNVRKTT